MLLVHPNRESKLLQKKWRRKRGRRGKGWKWLEPYCWYCIPGGSKRQVLKLRAAREEFSRMCRLDWPVCPKCGLEAITQPEESWVPSCQCGQGLCYYREEPEILKAPKRIEIEEK